MIMNKLISYLLLPLLMLGSCTPATLTYEKITLNESFYNNSAMLEVATKEEFETLTNSEASFIVYGYSNNCYACGLFNPLIEAFVRKEKIAIHKIVTTIFKDTVLNDLFFYTPSVAIFNKGQFYVMLDPTSNADSKAFTNSAAFTNWVYTYVNKL